MNPILAGDGIYSILYMAGSNARILRSGFVRFAQIPAFVMSYTDLEYQTTYII